MVSLFPLKSLRSRHLATASLLACLASAPRANAQEMDHSGMDMSHDPSPPTEHKDMTVLNFISPSREGSGTSWMPDESPMYGIHAQYKDWALMFHANVFVQSIQESSDRSKDRAGSINWAMVMATTKVADGDFTLRLMSSLENWTATKCGYPDLLQSGEVCDGNALHDRQHPHDLFMEVAAQYKRAFNSELGWEIYAAPAGEPALGPVAFPHRLSAFPGPQGPISHHWLDSTHISFGVLTAGLFGKQWKLEASAFNGREPDDNRSDFDLNRLDSYSGRISYLPSRNWSLQVSGGRLNDAEEHDGKAIDVTRYTTSAMYHRKLENMGIWATTAAYGENTENSHTSRATILESSFNSSNSHILSARIENVQKSGHDLVIEDPTLEEKTYSFTKMSLGYLYQFPAVKDWNPGLGVTGSVSKIPNELEDVYGSKRPTELVVYFSLRPAPMDMDMGLMKHNQ